MTPGSGPTHAGDSDPGVWVGLRPGVYVTCPELSVQGTLGSQHSGRLRLKGLNIQPVNLGSCWSAVRRPWGHAHAHYHIVPQPGQGTAGKALRLCPGCSTCWVWAGPDQRRGGGPWPGRVETEAGNAPHRKGLTAWPQLVT